MATVIYLLNDGIEASAWCNDSDFTRIYHIPSFIRVKRQEQDRVDALKVS